MEIIKRQRGFTLLELMISIVVISVGIIAVFTVITKYARQTGILRESLVASYLGREGIEIVKNIRDTNWVNGRDWDYGLTSCSSGCEADYQSQALDAYAAKTLYIDSATGLYQYDIVGIATPYKRKITVANPGSEEMDIQVDVTWDDYTITVKESLYNWKP